jgi:nogalonic acid methyl ester cyclase / aklanonic acid methyl ester cyclase
MTATDLARRALAAVESGDDDALAELIHPSHVDHAPQNGSTGPEGVRASLRWVRETFADRSVDIEDLIASGDRVVARVRFCATQIGELYAQPPTGRRFEAEHVHIWRVADGRLAEHWMFRDDIGTMRQLGLAA